MPRPSLAIPLSLLMVAACGGGSGLAGTSGGTGGPSAGLRSELGASVAEGVNFALGLVTVDHPGLPFGFNPVAGCPAPSNTDDTDHDNILDDANLTFTNPPCTSNLAVGSVGVTGVLGLHDGGLATTSDYNMAFTGLTWTFLDGASVMTETAVRNGLATRTGDPNSATVLIDDLTDRTKPGKAVAHVHVAGTVIFTPDAGNLINILGPLPKGSLTLAGSLTWRRSTEDLSLTVTTPVPLQFDPSCTSTQPIALGEVDLQGTVVNTTGIFKVVFAGCGNNPTVVFTE